MLSAKRATKNGGLPSARWPPPDGKSWTNCTIPWWTDRSSTRWVTWWNRRYCSRPRRTSIRYGQESGKWRRVLATLSLYAFGNDYKIYNWSLNMKRPFSILRWRCAVATPWVLWSTNLKIQIIKQRLKVDRLVFTGGSICFSVRVFQICAFQNQNCQMERLFH